MSLFKRKPLPDCIIAERVNTISGRVARLVRKDGRVYCECPYLCDVAFEPCEFGERLDWYLKELDSRHG